MPVPEACRIRQNPRGGPEAQSFDPCQAVIRIPRKVLKSGSHSCAPRTTATVIDRPAPHAEPVDTSMSHVGFGFVVGTRP